MMKTLNDHTNMLVARVMNNEERNQLNNLLQAKRVEDSKARKVVKKRKYDDPHKRTAQLLEANLEYSNKHAKALEDEALAM